MRFNRQAMRKIVASIEMMADQAGHDMSFVFGVTAADKPYIIGLGQGAAEQGLIVAVEVKDDVPVASRGPLAARIGQDLVQKIEDWKRVNPRVTGEGEGEGDTQEA